MLLLLLLLLLLILLFDDDDAVKRYSKDCRIIVDIVFNLQPVIYVTEPPEKLANIYIYLKTNKQTNKEQ